MQKTSLKLEVAFVEAEDGDARVDAGLRLLARAAVRFSQKRAQPLHDAGGGLAASGFPLLDHGAADAEEVRKRFLGEA